MSNAFVQKLTSQLFNTWIVIVKIHFSKMSNLPFQKTWAHKIIQREFGRVKDAYVVIIKMRHSNQNVCYIVLEIEGHSD